MNDSRHIMLIRHAEKPEPGEPVGPDDAAALSLSRRGWQRAGALVRFFAPLVLAAGASPPVVRPRHIVAAGSSAAHPSTRPGDTVAPLAALLGLAVETLPDDDEAALPALADHLRQQEGSVLVCWRREQLPALADALLQRHEAPRWPEDRYDLVWVMERSGVSWNFRQWPQQLLAGDRTQLIARRVAKAKPTDGAAA